MGPEAWSHGTSVLLRTPLLWDIKNGPWTDGRGDQKKHAEAFRQWCDFHVNLPAKNYNRIDAVN